MKQEHKLIITVSKEELIKKLVLLAKRDYEKYDFCMELPIGLSIKPIKKHKG